MTAPLSDDVHRRCLDLQARILREPPRPADSPKQLYKHLQRHLIRAVNEGRLTNSIADIHKNLRITENADGFTIYGARLERANFNRSREAAHFARDDKAWFDFLLSGRADRSGVEILAYSCELRFPEHLEAFPRFVRFDLNPPEHANEAPGLRCHLHPGHDDLQVAAPYMHPLDIVDFCVYGLSVPAKLRAK